MAPNRALSCVTLTTTKHGSVSFETLQWRQKIENRLKRVDDLEKSVLALRSEIIDEARRRKCLEEYILSKEVELESLLSQIRDKKKNVSGKDKPPSPVILTRHGGFDDSSKEALVSWLIVNGLNELVPLLKGDGSGAIVEEGKMEQGYLPMFQRVKDKLQISLAKCGISKLLEFIYLPEEDPLSRIWDRKFFIRDFVLTHQAFMGSQQLFKFLTLKCCSTGATTAIILMTKDFIQTLVKCLKLDIRANETWASMISQFASSIIRVNNDLSKDILKYLEGAYSFRSYAFKSSDFDFIPDLVIQNFISRNYDIMELESYPYELACQLTYLEQQYVFSTEIKEFLHQAWTTDKIPTPNLDKYIEFTNRVSGIFTREILVHPIARLQAQVISFIIEVANSLFKINNFNGLQMILACLHSPSIAKLKSAWALVSKKSREDFDRFSELMNPQNHYRSYEEALNSLDDQEVPVIPLLSMPLRDLFLTEDALQTVVTVPKGWINFDKMSKLSKIIWNFRKYQIKYNFTPILALLDYIEEKADSWDSKVSYEIAKLREENILIEWNILPPAPNNKFVEDVDFYNCEYLSIAEWQLILVGNERSHSVKPGTEIFRRGTDITQIYYVESGELTIDSLSDSHQRITIGTIGMHQLIGLECLLDNPFTSAVWIGTRTEAKLRPVNARHLLELFKTEMDLFSKCNKILAGQLAQLLKNSKKPPKKMPLASVSLSSTPELWSVKKKRTIPKSRSYKLKQKKPGFAETFNELEGEVVIKEYACQLKKGGIPITCHLFISQNYINFCGYNISVVKIRPKYSVPFREVLSIQRQGKSVILSCIKEMESKEEFEFTGFDNVEEVTEFLSGFWTRKCSRPENSTSQTTMDKDIWDLSPEDWEKILTASKECVYSAGQTILSPGSSQRVLYKIITGSCHTLKKHHIIYHMKEGDTFGCQEFLLNCTQSHHYEVKAATTTKVMRIDGVYLDVLFCYDVRLSGRFYRYLALQLSTQLNSVYVSQLERQMENVFSLMEHNI